MRKSLKILTVIVLNIILLVFQCSCQQETYYDWQLSYLGIPELWDKGTGKSVVVAVVDSGINYALLGNEFKENRVIASYNSYDCNDDLTDYTQHGTAMVLLIGANGENGFYGVAPECEFIIIKALNALGYTSEEALERAINFAIEYGANIINLSLGSTKYSQNIASLIDNAVENNIIITCAVGDQGKNDILFPSSYELTLSCGALDINGNIYESSNYTNSIDIFMPGVDIKIPSLNAKSELVFFNKSGSSIATAILSGYLADYVDYKKEYEVLEVYNRFRQKEFDIKNLF
ncbi:MAG: S8 family peptidase [Candidatus Coproplasma sp.]